MRSATERYKFDCGMDCGKTWSGDDLARIAKNVAWHWNKEHNDELKHAHRQFDEVERGGHHLHGNEYSVERIPIYITSFDVMQRIGKEDGHAVPAESEDVCKDCNEVIRDTSDAVLLEESVLGDEYRCSDCDEEREIERKASENEQITEWVA